MGRSNSSSKQSFMDYIENKIAKSEKRTYSFQGRFKTIGFVLYHLIIGKPGVLVFLLLVQNLKQILIYLLINSKAVEAAKILEDNLHQKTYTNAGSLENADYVSLSEQQKKDSDSKEYARVHKQVSRKADLTFKYIADLYELGLLWHFINVLDCSIIGAISSVVFKSNTIYKILKFCFNLGLVLSFLNAFLDYITQMKLGNLKEQEVVKTSISIIDRVTISEKLTTTIEFFKKRNFYKSKHYIDFIGRSFLNFCSFLFKFNYFITSIFVCFVKKKSFESKSFILFTPMFSSYRKGCWSQIYIYSALKNNGTYYSRFGSKRGDAFSPGLYQKRTFKEILATAINILVPFSSINGAKDIVYSKSYVFSEKFSKNLFTSFMMSVSVFRFKYNLFSFFKKVFEGEF